MSERLRPIRPKIAEQDNLFKECRKSVQQFNNFCQGWEHPWGSELTDVTNAPYKKLCSSMRFIRKEGLMCLQDYVAMVNWIIVFATVATTYVYTPLARSEVATNNMLNSLELHPIGDKWPQPLHMEWVRRNGMEREKVGHTTNIATRVSHNTIWARRHALDFATLCTHRGFDIAGAEVTKGSILLWPGAWVACHQLVAWMLA